MNNLSDRYILNTRPSGQNESLTQLLKQQGANVLEFPLLQIKPQEFSENLLELTNSDAISAWLVFTSANGVWTFDEGIKKLDVDKYQKIKLIPCAAIGLKTADSLRNLGYTVSFVAQNPYSEDFAAGFIDFLETNKPSKGTANKIFLIRGNTASEALPELLAPQSYEIYPITSYDSILPTYSDDQLSSLYRGLGLVREPLAPSAVFDVIILTSAQAAKNLYLSVLNFGEDGIDFWNQHVVNVPVAVIGVKTANVTSELGFLKVFIAKEATTEALVDTIISGLS